MAISRSGVLNKIKDHSYEGPTFKSLEFKSDLEGAHFGSPLPVEVMNRVYTWSWASVGAGSWQERLTEVLSHYRDHADMAKLGYHACMLETLREATKRGETVCRMCYENTKEIPKLGCIDFVQFSKDPCLHHQEWLDCVLPPMDKITGSSSNS